MRRKSVGVLAAALLLPLTTAGCEVGSDDQPVGGEIVIAADLELSGAYASIGTAYNRALTLKIEEINDQGGVGGRKLALMVKDNRSDPSVSLADVVDFANRPGVAAIVMGACSACAVGAAKTIEDKHLPTISLGSANEIGAPAQEHQFTFKVGPNPGDSAAVLTDEIKNSDVTSVGLLSSNDMDGRDAVKAIRTSISNTDIVVLGQGSFKPTDTDLSDAATGAVAAHPDAVLISATPEQALLATAAARKAGFKGQFFFNTTAAGSLFPTGTGAQTTDGTIMVATRTLATDDTIATTPAEAARLRWFNDYVSRYGDFSGYSSYAGDAVQIIVNAVAKAGINHDKIRDLLESTQFEGLSGPIRITPQNHSGLMPQALTVLVSSGGRWHLLT